MNPNDRLIENIIRDKIKKNLTIENQRLSILTYSIKKSTIFIIQRIIDEELDYNMLHCFYRPDCWAECIELIDFNLIDKIKYLSIYSKRTKVQFSDKLLNFFTYKLHQRVLINRNFQEEKNKVINLLQTHTGDDINISYYQPYNNTITFFNDDFMAIFLLDYEKIFPEKSMILQLGGL